MADLQAEYMPKHGQGIDREIRGSRRMREWLVAKLEAARAIVFHRKYRTVLCLYAGRTSKGPLGMDDSCVLRWVGSGHLGLLYQLDHGRRAMGQRYRVGSQQHHGRSLVCVS